MLFKEEIKARMLYLRISHVLFEVQVEQNVVFELAQVEKKRITCVSSCTPLHTAPVFRISKTVWWELPGGVGDGLGEWWGAGEEWGAGEGRGLGEGAGVGCVVLWWLFLNFDFFVVASTCDETQRIDQRTKIKYRHLTHCRAPPDAAPAAPDRWDIVACRKALTVWFDKAIRSQAADE